MTKEELLELYQEAADATHLAPYLVDYCVTDSKKIHAVVTNSRVAKAWDFLSYLRRELNDA